MKLCKFNGCLNRSILDYCKREHDHLNPKKEKLKKARVPVNKVSDKERVRQQQYRKARIAFLKQIPYCEVRAEGCTHQATEVHHKAGRIGENLLDVSTWLSTCHNCHEKIEQQPKWAKENGFSISRLNKAS